MSFNLRFPAATATTEKHPELTVTSHFSPLSHFHPLQSVSGPQPHQSSIVRETSDSPVAKPNCHLSWHLLLDLSAGFYEDPDPIFFLGLNDPLVFLSF